MGKTFERIDERLTAFIEKQPLFFVASAAADARVNVSPKGGIGTLVVIDPTTVAYLDLTGSGIETIAHARAGGQVTLMWCAFSGAPRIVRVYGTARYVVPGDEEWEGLLARFTQHPGARAIIVVTGDSISDSCGMAVPLMDLVAERDQLDRWADFKSEAEMDQYHRDKNSRSIDGLPGLPHA